MTAIENFAEALEQDRAETKSPESVTSGPAITAHLLYVTRNNGPHVLAALHAYRDRHGAPCGCEGCDLYESESDSLEEL